MLEDLINCVTDLAGDSSTLLIHTLATSSCMSWSDQWLCPENLVVVGNKSGKIIMTAPPPIMWPSSQHVKHVWYGDSRRSTQLPGLRQPVDSSLQPGTGFFAIVCKNYGYFLDCSVNFSYANWVFFALVSDESFQKSIFREISPAKKL